MLIMVLNVLCRLFLINKNVLKNEKIEAKSHKPASFSKKSTGQPYGETFRERPSAHLLCLVKRFLKTLWAAVYSVSFI